VSHRETQDHKEVRDYVYTLTIGEYCHRIGAMREKPYTSIVVMMLSQGDV
jgi:hypothetical protein